MTSFSSPQFALTITDLGGDRLELLLRDGSEQRRVHATLATPIDAPVARTLRWYVAEARAALDVDPARLVEAERGFERAGRALGSALLDADGVFAGWIERLSAEPTRGLGVEVRSDRPTFSGMPWELLTLPGTTLVLGLHARSLCRRPLNWEDRRRTNTPSQEPLAVLRMVARGRDDEHTGARTQALAWQRDLLRWTGRLRADVWVERSRDALAAHYRDAGGFPTVVHYQGPLRDADGPYGEGELSPEWLSFLAGAGVRLLLIDPVGRHEREHDAKIAQVALDAVRAGIDHVVCIAAFTDGALSEACLASVYERIASGIDVEASVAAARIELERRFDEVRASSVRPPRESRGMHLLQHFGGGSWTPFDAPGTAMRSEESQALARVRARSFGFLPRYLPPTDLGLVSPHGLALLADLHAHRTPVVLAARGMGSTHALHEVCFSYLLQSSAEAAFYWDFDDELYDLVALCQMVASALGIEQPEHASLDQVCDRLERGRCMLVFENLDRLCTRRDSLVNGVGKLLSRLVGSKQVHCLLSVKHARSLDALRAVVDGVLTERRLAPWSEPYQLATVTRFVQPDAPHRAATLQGLIGADGGHPFLLRQRLSMWNRAGTFPQRPRELAAARLDALDCDVVSSFWRERWLTLEPAFQRLLAVCAHTTLFVEVWMVAFDRPERQQSEAARRVWSLLDIPVDVRFSDAIAAFERAGLMSHESGGHTLVPSARSFVRAEAGELPDAVHTELERAIRDALPAIVKRTRAQPSESVLAMLLRNRQFLADAIEHGWRDEPSQGVFRALLGLEDLMRQARLPAAMPPFARHLLALPRSQELLASERPLAGMLWLSLAIRALAAEGAAHDAQITHAVEHWLARVLDEDWRSDERSPQIELALAFLQRALDLRADYPKFREVGRVALDFHRKRGDDLAQITQLCALAACEHELGDAAQCHELERRALEEMSYERLPQGTRARVHLDIASMRLRRGDLDGSATLAETLELGDDHALQERHQLLLAELALARGESERACELLVSLWQSASGKPGRVSVDRLAALLDSTSLQLGAARFQAIYDANAAGVPSPAQLRAIVRRGEAGIDA